ncbi:MAG TPA: metalloregulator ArsR/SmtB family transcription factor [Verrucomicrobiae bacterium]|nr:metalloregulator ArsR/SmtB family transcription factor [Verrucomicrobiae bacterium]
MGKTKYRGWDQRNRKVSAKVTATYNPGDRTAIELSARGKTMTASILTSIYMAQLDQAFAALADPTRRGIVVRLARGEASVSDLVGHFSLTQPTISSHLKVLETAGLISRRRVAQLRPCRLVPERLKAVADWLEQVQEIWEGNYKRLDALLLELKQAEKQVRKK